MGDAGLLTLEKLRQAHGSVPANPPLAEPMYLAGYIERMGTGTRDMSGTASKQVCRSRILPGACGFQTIIRRAPAPGRGSQPESLETRILLLLEGDPKSKAELSRELGQKRVSGQLNKVVRQLLADRMIRYTIPEKPGSRNQKYRLTDKGRAALPKPGSREDTS